MECITISLEARISLTVKMMINITKIAPGTHNFEGADPRILYIYPPFWQSIPFVNF